MKDKFGAAADTPEFLRASDGTEVWHLNGKRHREDGPALVTPAGNKNWYRNGQRHREDGPAVEETSGIQEWYLNDKLHREDGPAVIWPGIKSIWYQNGRMHREGGPAVERADGRIEWWLKGKQLNALQIQLMKERQESVTTVMKKGLTQPVRAPTTARFKK